jgi:hypothetical protein
MFKKDTRALVNKIINFLKTGAKSHSRMIPLPGGARGGSCKSPITDYRSAAKIPRFSGTDYRLLLIFTL